MYYRILGIPVIDIGRSQYDPFLANSMYKSVAIVLLLCIYA